MRDVCPCFNCEMRSALCHAHCEKYPAWVKRLQEQRKRAQKDRDINAYTKKVADQTRKRLKLKGGGQV